MLKQRFHNFLIIGFLGTVFGIFNYHWLIDAYNVLDKKWELHINDSARIIASIEERLKLGVEKENLYLSSFSELQFIEKEEIESINLDFKLGEEGVLEILMGEPPILYSIKLSRYGNIESGYFKIIEGKYHPQVFPFKDKFLNSGRNNFRLDAYEEYLKLFINNDTCQLKRDMAVKLTPLRIRSGVETIVIDNVTVRIENGAIFQNRFESPFKKRPVALIIISISCLTLFIIRFLGSKILSKIVAQNNKSLNRYYKTICFILIVAIFGAAEFLSRASDFNQPWRPKWKVQKDTHVLTADDYLLWLPDVQTNPREKMSFRGKEYSIEKPGDTLRIVCLGDSTTWGQGVQRFEDTYPGVLNTMLSRDEGEKQFEVINAGVPGYSSFQGLRFLKKYILKLSPDIITVRFFANDISDNLKIGTTMTDREYWIERENKKSGSKIFIFLQDALPESKVISDIKKIFFDLKIKFKLVKPKKRVPLNEYIYNLKEIARVARDNNMKVFFIYETLATGYTSRDMASRHPYFKALKLVSEEEDVRLIDPITSFVDEKHGDLFFDEIHPTPQGHRIIAEEILKALKNEGFIQ